MRLKLGQRRGVPSAADGWARACAQAADSPCALRGERENNPTAEDLRQNVKGSHVIRGDDKVKNSKSCREILGKAECEGGFLSACCCHRDPSPRPPPPQSHPPSISTTTFPPF